VTEVGVSIHDSLMVADPVSRRAVLGRAKAAGLDHVTVGDHISFHGGTGFDGLVSATSVLSTDDDLSVLVGVYQLALRHPMATARQLSSIGQLAPGRLTLGVGAGGEDRAEISNAGVDPSTRGRRLDEALQLLGALSTGEAVDFAGEFFQVSSARILPPPRPRIPIVVGGKGEAAVRRTARFGDGWLGMFCSARRFGATREQVLEAAVEFGREPGWFGLSVWCGLDADENTARELLGQEMEALYRLPAEKFRHVTAAGKPGQVAEQLAPFVAAGAQSITIVPAAASTEAAIDAVAEVRELLSSGASQPSP
jgi:alkanesulfonate monooxygenase SsuD/methylene tetrahydromethanopterin reductase-like flavin-dependent oxidoreductase (luciferase family)